MIRRLISSIPILALLLSLCCYTAAGQDSGVAPTVRTRLVPDTIVIGDQFIMELEIDKDVAQEIQLPQFENNQVTKEIEMIRIDGVDTLSSSGRRLKLKVKYRLSSFTAGQHILSGFPILYSDRDRVDTIRSMTPMSLVVNTFEIDTTQQKPIDIKRPINTPLVFSEIRDWVIYGSLAAILLAGIIYLIIREIKRRRGIVRPRKMIPPHVIAIRSLELLHSQKLWQNGRHKEYYSTLSDIVRTYIEDRYSIAAMEMTTDQIIEAMIDLNDKALIVKLREMLSVADLAKFAKFSPTPDQNEQAYFDTYFYVEETKDMTAGANPDQATGDNPLSGNVATIAALLLLLPATAAAQSERSDIRAGNRAYHEGKYPEAEVNYKRAIEKKIGSYEANFNLAGALFKQGRYQDATATYTQLAQDNTNPEAQAATLYNLGNVQLTERKLDEAIESYKSALRITPNDRDAKFNLAYAQKLKQEEENKDQNKDQDQNQNKDNKDQNQDQDKKDQDQNDQNKDKEQDQNKDQDQDQDQDQEKNQPQNPEQQQSREENERTLKAIQASEDNTKKKVDEQKAAAVGVSNGKQW